METTSAFTLVDGLGRMLLQLRSEDAPTYPGHWGFFGGHLEDGESHFEAVIREAREELGLELGVPCYLGTYQGRAQRTALYVRPLEHDLDSLRRSQTEGDGLDVFFDFDVPDLLMPDLDRSLVRVVSWWWGTSGRDARR